MTHPMVEKVARAICDDQLWPGAWIKTNEVEMDAYNRQARAAIAAVLDAMREPSEGMQEAALDLRMDSPYTDAWRAMLDACREEVLG